ncbi:unnamed protein product [Didymodactylos carnosus]|uniref:Uncharacterized protein n=1 Tax=Didymodactylos carnosus TaxID=1234261 RepID=A0A814ZKK4_9BILA|nr:unnamed protein product [Didymodactylos carnosus]CAF1244839.1 unnamed protein product [Didymodactylos carnosus]CAF3831939.1 unnamed protein product [Didymodactylos carnosus]CAF4010044.1 unnamed protein product [Didymodactylos carnosus]
MARAIKDKEKTFIDGAITFSFRKNSKDLESLSHMSDDKLPSVDGERKVAGDSGIDSTSSDSITERATELQGNVLHI